MSLAYHRLLKAERRAQIVPFDQTSKFIIMSDCHRGQGNTGDNFLPNQILFFGALEYYFNKGFTYIELGDGDELWENRKIKPIITAHSDVFALMSRFHQKNRLYMLYGNHDIVKRRKVTAQQNYKNFYCENSRCLKPLFPDIQMYEGLLLKNKNLEKNILLIHGHQGSFLNDTLWLLARFLVRYIWKPLELIGFTAPTGAGRSYMNKDKIERDLSAFADARRQILIAGHTHRAFYPAPGESLYFNDGSCIHPKCITGLEIENNQITLVKWAVGIRKDQSLYVKRQVLEGPTDLIMY